MQTRWTNASLAFVLLMAGLPLMACSVTHESTPAGPTAPTTPGQTGVSGRWGTDISVQGVTARMTWTLTQVGTSVTGPVLVSLPTGIVLLNGSLTGTINNSSLPYSIAVGAGGVPSQPTCTGQFGGTMTVAVTTMTGPMSLLSSSCTVQFPSNAVTMTKQ